MFAFIIMCKAGNLPELCGRSWGKNKIHEAIRFTCQVAQFLVAEALQECLFNVKGDNDPIWMCGCLRAYELLAEANGRPTLCFA